MASVNMHSIFSKCKDYSETPAGKEKMRSAIRKMRKDGKSATAAGSEILTPSKMADLANELIRVLRDTAASYDLAPSVMAHFDNLKYVVTDLGNDRYECAIYFADDLSRPSLIEDDGINNIVALFNNGYVASSYVYGWWDGHKPTGECIYQSAGFIYDSAFIRSKIARPTLRFMQRAIDDFMAKYSNKYNMSVVLNDAEYDGNYA